MTDAEVEPISAATVEAHLGAITLIEVKSTRAAIQDAALNGFFFGATETEYALAAALGDRFRYAFVVLNSANAYRHPFFVLLTHAQLQEKTRTRRIQYQVNLRTDMALTGNEQVFHSVPALIALEAEQVATDDSVL